MDIRQLRYFVAIVESGSITRPKTIPGLNARSAAIVFRIPAVRRHRQFAPEAPRGQPESDLVVRQVGALAAKRREREVVHVLRHGPDPRKFLGGLPLARQFQEDLLGFDSANAIVQFLTIRHG